MPGSSSGPGDAVHGQPQSNGIGPLVALSSPALVRFLLLFLSGWAAVTLVAYFYNVIALFVVAAILAVLLNGLVGILTRWLPRGLAIVATVSLLLLGLSALLGGVGLQVAGQAGGLIADLESTIDRTQLPFLRELRAIDLDRVLAMLTSHLGSGLGMLGGAVTNLLGVIFLLVLTIYMLVDNGRLWRSLLTLLPEDVRGRFDRSVQRNLLAFLRGQLTLVLFLSLTSLLAFVVLGVKFALVLAIIMGVLDAIPGIGATLGVLVVSSIVLVTQGHLLALAVVGVSLLLQQIQDNLIHPKVMGAALEINPLVLFFALFVGERIAGLLGLFLAIPIAGMVVSWRSRPIDP
jgi:predicted PurR-regulated permease PerM